MQIESITHPGFHRTNNEDRCLVNALDNDHALLAIADGMGGHAAGEVAAQIAVERLRRASAPVTLILSLRLSIE